MKQQVAAGIFKTHCLRYLDEVNRTRKELIITKRGKPVARLVPVEQGQSRVVGRLNGTVTVLGDIIGPTGEQWEADQ